MFGAAPDFSLGVEEELLIVAPDTLALSHTGLDVLARMDVGPGEGSAHPDTYRAIVELASPITADAAEGTAALSRLRASMRAAGGTAIGAGIHPAGAFGDVVHVDADRYREIEDHVRGLLRRTPTCALHVHVGMPDGESAIRAYNGLREQLPLLQALAANSPFWHGRDSGLASARAALFRGYPQGDVPRAFADYADYEAAVEQVRAAGNLPDYTFLWWDVRPHPRLGTVEVRAMDSQSSLGSVAGLAALVHGLARRAAEEEDAGPWTPREVLTESSFRAARDGLDGLLWDGDRLRATRELVAESLERARPAARELGSGDALDEVERILREGNGAHRQRAAAEGGGLRAQLELLARETAEPFNRGGSQLP